MHVALVQRSAWSQHCSSSLIIVKVTAVKASPGACLNRSDCRFYVQLIAAPRIVPMRIFGA